MALADIAARLDPNIPHKTCAVCHHMSERGPEWAEKLRGLLRNRSVRFLDLARELADDPDEPNIPSAAMGRHAGGNCAANERLR